jgi:8-oxo-dGTP pyrophosphatase MutT (NUDIX family)
MIEDSCLKGCCAIKRGGIVKKFDRWITKQSTVGSGILMIHSKTGKILVTQSYHTYWGIPKGKKKEYESFEECALREVKEETSLRVPSGVLKKIKIYTPPYDIKTYIHIYLCYVNTIDPIIGNLDCTGIGWVYPSCLRSMKINLLTRLLLTQLPTFNSTLLKETDTDDEYW